MSVVQFKDIKKNVARHLEFFNRSASSAALLAALSVPCSAAQLEVIVDTSALAGTSAQLAFDLLDGDPAINQAQIAGFSTDGSLGTASFTGAVTGDLASGVTISDTDFFNELLQPIVLASTIRFNLFLTEQATPGSLFPDSFAFFVLDDIGLPLFSTTDPLGGDALFSIDIDGSSPGNLAVYPATSSPAAVVTVQPLAVSAPGSLGMVLMGLVGWGWRRRSVQP